MRKPEPNGEPVPTLDGCTVEYKVCSCCQPTAKVPHPPSKHRFFVRDVEGEVVCMCGDWDMLCEHRGWANDDT